MLISAWIILTKYIFPISFVTSNETKIKLKEMLDELGPLSKDEMKISIIFGLDSLSLDF